MSPHPQELALLSHLEPELVDALRRWSSGPGWLVYDWSQNGRQVDLRDGDQGIPVAVDIFHRAAGITETCPARWLPADPCAILEAVDWAAQEKHSVRGQRQLCVRDLFVAASLHGRHVGTDASRSWLASGASPRLAALRLLQRVWWGSLTDHVFELLHKGETAEATAVVIALSSSEWKEIMLEWQMSGKEMPTVDAGIHRRLFGLPATLSTEDDNIVVTTGPR